MYPQDSPGKIFPLYRAGWETAARPEGTLDAMMQRGQQQNSEYAGLGLPPEEYCVRVAIAEYQQKLARVARKAA